MGMNGSWKKLEVASLAPMDCYLDYILHQSPDGIGRIANPFTYIIKHVSFRYIISFDLPKDPV